MPDARRVGGERTGRGGRRGCSRSDWSLTVAGFGTYFRNMFQKYRTGNPGNQSPTPAGRPGHPRRPGSNPALVLAAVAVVQFMVSLDLSVVNVALPAIGRGLGFGAAGLTWVIHAYALTFGGMLLLGGKAADLYGRKPVLLLGLTLFALASLAGGLAQLPGHLVAARAAQGIGAAAVAPAALSLLTSAFPQGRPRVKAFGVWSAVNAAGAALGVLIGGVLAEFAGWRWVMFVNVPMAAVAFALVQRAVHRDRPDLRQGRPDLPGALLATGGLTLLVFTVVRTDEVGWTSPATIAGGAGALVLLSAFVGVERVTSADPLLRLRLLGNRSVAGANLYILLVGAAMASSFYFLSLYLQLVLGTGAARSGLQFLPFALGVVVGSVLAIKLGYSVPARILLISGAVLTAIGFIWFARLDAEGTFLTDVLGPSIVTSIGFGLCLGPASSIATTGVDAAEVGTASGLLNSSRQIGASLGLAALGTAAQQRIANESDSGTAALVSGYAVGFGIGAALLGAAAVVALTVLPRTATQGRHSQPSPRPEMAPR